jgi:hypothetical protein
MNAMISEEVRAAESDIDEKIRGLPIWRSGKNRLLEGLMDFWRDGLELAYAKFGHADMFQSSESLEAAIATEHQISTGVFWCLKWTLEYASGVGAAEPISEQLVDTVIGVGAPYQILVDALKFAGAGGMEVEVDTNERVLKVY